MTHLLTNWIAIIGAVLIVSILLALSFMWVLGMTKDQAQNDKEFHENI